MLLVDYLVRKIPETVLFLFLVKLNCPSTLLPSKNIHGNPASLVAAIEMTKRSSKMNKANHKLYKSFTPNHEKNEMHRLNYCNNNPDHFGLYGKWSK